MSLNVLVVDDSALMRKMVIRVLHMSNLQIGKVWEAGGGREALDVLARETDINLGLIDVNMPGMNGEDLVRNIRANAQLTELPLIMVSTEGSDVRIERFRQMGAGFVKKPFGPEVLVDAITSATLGG